MLKLLVNMKSITMMLLVTISSYVVGQEVNVTSSFSNITKSNVFKDINLIKDGDQFSYVNVNNPASITMTRSTPIAVSRITYVMANIESGNISCRSNGQWISLGSFSAMSSNTRERVVNRTIDAIRFSNIREDERGRVYEIGIFSGNSSSSKRADLVVDRLRISPGSIVAGKTFTPSVNIKNNGTGNAGSSHVGFYLSQNNTLSLDDILLAERPLPGINSKKIRTIAPSLKIPDDYVKPNSYLIIVVDHKNAIKESIENNNRRIKAISVISAFPAICPGRSPIPDSWDWRTPSYKALIFNLNNNKSVVNIPSPWFASNTNNSNVNDFRIQNPKDFQPADGWVLIQKDLGDIISQRAVNHPYFVLYNKLTGTLRIFVAISKDIGNNNSGVISLHFLNGTNRTALLEHHSQSQFKNALDKFDPAVPAINVPNAYAFQNPTFWMHADFSMAYDPCSCNDLSQIVFDVKLINNASLQFTTNGKQIQNLDAQGKGNGSQQSLTKNLQGLIDAGTSFHKSTKKGLDMIKDIFPGVNYAENPLYNKIPGVGAALGVVDFLVTLITKKPATATPIVFDLDLKSSGNITFTNAFRQTILEVPGSKTEFLIPPTLLKYNNVLGVFNLLETPVITKAETKIGGYNWRKSRLSKHPSFVINPAAGFDPGKVNIKAAFIIKHQGSNSFIHDNPEIDWTIIENRRVGRTYVQKWETELFDIACIKDITLRFRHNSLTQVGLKIVASLKTSDDKQTIYASTFKTISQTHPRGYGDNVYWINTGVNCSGQLLASNPQQVCSLRTLQFSGRQSIAPQLASDNKEGTLINTTSVFPNPLKNKLNVLLKLDKATVVTIKLRNINGTVTRLLYDAQQLAKGPHQLEFKSLNIPKGVYLLEVTKNNVPEWFKVVINP